MAFVIGTAGHIDHGKTALVQALTGLNTDNLPAEKERGISIDLGFAHFTLPDGQQVGIVDVPGHERFIRNMVAGAHGIDLVLFVIAADDGVMPQTEEHFAILRALGVGRAIFVVTKSDLVEPVRLAEVSEEIDLLVYHSAFETSEVLFVSSKTGAGIAALKTRIAELLNPDTEHRTIGVFRMPIDRVFTIQGRGVVVTGTMISGAVSKGDEIVIVPGDAVGRVRGLQSHGIDIECGKSGQRLAINLTGIDRHNISRGDVACAPTIARVSDRFDVELHLSDLASRDLKSGQRLRLHLGTAERHGRVVRLGKRLDDGDNQPQFAQITVSEPMQVMARDRFVIRDEQAEHTLGGGRVLDPVAVKTRVDDPAKLAFLAASSAGDTIGAAKGMIATGDLAMLAPELCFRLNVTLAALRAMAAKGTSLVEIAVGSDLWVSSVEELNGFNQTLTTNLAMFHKSQPSANGQNAEMLRAQIAPGTDLKLFRALTDRVVEAGLLTRQGPELALPDHLAALTTAEQDRAADLLETLTLAPFSPPLLDEKDKDLNAIVAFLERRGELVRISHNLAFSASAMDKAIELLDAHLGHHGKISAGDFRTLLGTSRKYALALLENFDRTGRTVRVGDVRKAGKLPVDDQIPT